MKKLKFILAILVIALVFAGSTMTLASCNNNTTKGSGGSGGGGGGGRVSGTYNFDSGGLSITFSGNNFNEYAFGDLIYSGTFTILGNTLTLSYLGGWAIFDWTIIDDRTLRDDDGHLWRK